MPDITEPTPPAGDVSQVSAPVAETPESHSTESLPKWARDAITKANKEAETARLKLKERADADAEAERKAAEQQGEFKRLYEAEQQRLRDLETQLAARDRADLQRRIATEAGLPAELASRLVGDDEAALTADAERLAKLLKPATPGIDATNPASSRGKTGTAFDPKNPPRLGAPGLFKS